MKARKTIVLLGAAMIATPVGATDRTDDFLTPHVAVGDRLDSVFAKTTAITGSGFSPVVLRISGSASDKIAAMSADEIREEEHYVYDGFASGDDVVQVRDHGRTNCVDDKCAANDQTSAPLFNPLLWGAIPNRLRAGDSWTTTISKPWEIGPAGVERVRVAGLVPASGLVMLVREGEGEGPSSDDARRPSLPIVAGNKKLACRVILGKAHWRGVATVIRGVTWADEIVVERPVELVADSGERFTGTQRVYTLFQRSPTSLGDPMRSGA